MYRTYGGGCVEERQGIAPSHVHVENRHRDAPHVQGAAEDACQGAHDRHAHGLKLLHGLFDHDVQLHDGQRSQRVDQHIDARAWRGMGGA